MNLYEILGVEFNATLKEIKKAYHKKCMEYHPDVKGNDPYYHELMCKLNEAYEVLSNPEKRREYDEMLLNERNKKGKSSPKENEDIPKESTNDGRNGNKYETQEQVWYYQEYYDEDLEQEEYEYYIKWLENYINEYKKHFGNIYNESEMYYNLLKQFENIIEYEYFKYNHKKRRNYMSK